MLCDTFKQLALNTWNKIEISRKANFQLKEETFTDINMMEIKLHHSRQVTTTVFSKPIEGKNGADWEWWFNDNCGNWLGFRVQAKILNNKSEVFEHLHYRKQRTKDYQCDKLIRNAFSGGKPMIPLYCFYIQTNNSTLLNHWNCGSFSPTKELLGCALISAFTVKQLRVTNSRHLSDVETFIKPWHCLVCCSGYGGRSSIEKMHNYAKKNFDLKLEWGKEFDIVIPVDFITKNPPSYVSALLNKEKNSGIQPPDKELDGIMVYTFDEKEK